MSRQCKDQEIKPMPDYLAKVIVLGNSAVGKTSILTRYTWEAKGQEYRLCHTPTIGVDFKSKVI